MPQLILASTSPRRQEIMKKLGLNFTVVASDFEEDMSLDLSATELAKKLAYGKAEAVARYYSNAIVIGADSFVAMGEEKLGKPKDIDEARAMLRRISGQKQRILTGMSVIDTTTQKVITIALEGAVYFRPISDEELDAYIATGEPMGKAGAYEVQGIGSMFIERIEGDFFAMMGLSAYRLGLILQQLGYPILGLKRTD